VDSDSTARFERQPVQKFLNYALFMLLCACAHE